MTDPDLDSTDVTVEQKLPTRHGVNLSIAAGKKAFAKGDLRRAEITFREVARQINQLRQLTGEIPMRVAAETVLAEGFQPAPLIRPLLDLAINVLPFNSRVREVCSQRRWTFLGHVAQTRPQDWSNIRNLGRKSLSEIAGVLFCCHLQFGLTLSDWTPPTIDPEIGPVSTDAALERARELGITVLKERHKFP